MIKALPILCSATQMAYAPPKSWPLGSLVLIIAVTDPILFCGIDHFHFYLKII